MFDLKPNFRSISAALAAVGFFVILSAPASATDYSSAGFTVRDPVIGSGAVNYAASPHFQLISSFGQVNYDLENSASFIDCNGFLYFEGAGPSALTGTPGGCQANFTWTAAAALCGNVITGYRVGTSTTPGGPYAYQNAGNVLTYLKTGLAGGTTYYAVVEALSGTVSLSRSNEVALTAAATGGSCAGGGGGGGGGGGSGGIGTLCGDKICTPNESYATCPTDCPAPPPTPAPAPVCGDGVCTWPETTPTCPADCPAAPSAPACVTDCSQVSYDLFIVDPDGTERHTGTPWVVTTALSAAAVRHSFEDKSLAPGDPANDHNDVVVDVAKSDCRNLKFDVIRVNGAWRHQIWVTIFYKGVRKISLLIAPDSHEAVGMSRTIDAVSEDVCRPAPATRPVETPPGTLMVGDLIKGEQATVYYYGRDGKRHVFPQAKIYKSWFADFSTVKTVPSQQLATIPLGQNVRYRPGSRLIKIVSDPKVYAVAARGLLRWVTTGGVASTLFGLNWPRVVEDISDAFFNDYYVGAPVMAASDFDPLRTLVDSTSIDDDLGLPETAPPLPAGRSAVRPACYATGQFTDLLGVGSTDVQVRPLQELLQCLGFLDKSIKPTGNYGPLTAAAVRAFQLANGIAPADFTSAATLDALNRYVLTPARQTGSTGPAAPAPAAASGCARSIEFTQTLSAGSSNVEVRPLQQLLQCLGFFPQDITPTGNFGAVTEAAVRAFQSANGITPTGTVGPATRAKLNGYGG